MKLSAGGLLGLPLSLLHLYSTWTTWDDIVQEVGERGAGPRDFPMAKTKSYIHHKAEDI